MEECLDTGSMIFDNFWWIFGGLFLLSLFSVTADDIYFWIWCRIQHFKNHRRRPDLYTHWWYEDR